jgi:hypothetical protein
MPSGDGTPRIYSKASDTATGAVNYAMLLDEIEADAGITTALRSGANGGWVGADGDELRIYFVAALGAPEITALDALVLAHAGTVTILDFQFWELNPASTTTNETFTEVMSRTASALQAGTYVLTWYFEMKVTVTGPLNSNGMGQFLVDGSVKGSANAARTEWTAFSGWDRYVAAEGDAPVLSLEIQRDPTEGGNDTIEIRKMKLGIERKD